MLFAKNLLFKVHFSAHNVYNGVNMPDIAIIAITAGFRLISTIWLSKNTLFNMWLNWKASYSVLQSTSSIKTKSVHISTFAKYIVLIAYFFSEYLGGMAFLIANNCIHMYLQGKLRTLKRKQNAFIFILWLLIFTLYFFGYCAPTYWAPHFLDSTHRGVYPILWNLEWVGCA